MFGGRHDRGESANCHNNNRQRKPDGARRGNPFGLDPQTLDILELHAIVGVLHFGVDFILIHGAAGRIECNFCARFSSDADDVLLLRMRHGADIGSLHFGNHAAGIRPENQHGYNQSENLPVGRRLPHKGTLLVAISVNQKADVSGLFFAG